MGYRCGPKLALIRYMNTQCKDPDTLAFHLETAVSPDASAFEHHALPATTRSAARQIAAAPPDLGGTVDVVVCIPAFRRPDHLRLTLSSVAAQQTDRRFAVVVVENDHAKQGSVPEAARFFAETAIPGLCIVEPRQGNCHAINAAFQTALAVFPQATKFMMIDDDEIASMHWIERMVATAETTDADIVGGPVLPQFFDRRCTHLAEHPAFRPAYDKSGPVSMIYGSGNCLIQRRVFDNLASPSFDLRFNLLGGGDTDFFLRCRDQGMAFYWSADAVIAETVPPSRTSLKWLMLRGLRIGAINYHAQLKATRTTLSRLKLWAKFIALLPMSVARAGRLAAQDTTATIALHPVMVAMGGVLAALGIEQQPYKVSAMARERVDLSGTKT